MITIVEKKHHHSILSLTQQHKLTEANVCFVRQNWTLNLGNIGAEALKVLSQGMLTFQGGYVFSKI